VSAPLWVTELAAAFWAAAGGPEPFPRRLRGPIGRAFVFTVVDRPRLSVAGALDWLARTGVSCAWGMCDRPLRACLVAAGGAGFAFIDADDPEDERRFSLAHELAHFLRDYWRPRGRALTKLGPAAAEVFDGRREPTTVERLRALLSNTALGPHIHLMDRGPRSKVVDQQVRAAEEDADRLAYELLAPAAAVCRIDRSPSTLAGTLSNVFGLPPAQAEDYTRLLVPPSTPDPFILRLRGKP
jgi:hypothetical protein